MCSSDLFPSHDIGGLGWKMQPIEKYRVFKTIFVFKNEDKTLYCSFGESILVSIYKFSELMDCKVCIFNGTIRNKSELATIMRMIGIKN